MVGFNLEHPRGNKKLDECLSCIFDCAFVHSQDLGAYNKRVINIFKCKRQTMACLLGLSVIFTCSSGVSQFLVLKKKRLASWVQKWANLLMCCSQFPVQYSNYTFKRSRPSRNCERFNAISATGGAAFELFCYKAVEDVPA